MNRPCPRKAIQGEMKHAWLWLLVSLLAPAVLALGQGPRPDPLPLRRVFVEPERVPAVLESAQKGMMQLMPRSEFEAKVQQAALALELVSQPPRIVKTFYTAQLIDQS